MELRGLYSKYTIINNDTGLPVKGATFTLKPDKDPAARAALRAYADATDNKQLAEELRYWADHEFVPCGCRGIADCSHLNGGYYRKRSEMEAET